MGIIRTGFAPCHGNKGRTYYQASGYKLSNNSTTKFVTQKKRPPPRFIVRKRRKKLAAHFGKPPFQRLRLLGGNGLDKPQKLFHISNSLYNNLSI